VWEYAVSAQVVTFMERLAPRQRRQLRLALDRMAEHPPLDATVAFVDLTGRWQRMHRDGEFEILFWADLSIGELRITEVDFAQS
jgi:hypothetical protein